MQQEISPREAVRLARENLGNVSSAELAAYIQEVFGLTIKPPFVSVLLGSLQERALLDQSRQLARERIERWKAENPEQARKLAAAARRRQAAQKKKEATAKPALTEAEEAPPNASAVDS
jgi:hypothetical protein